MVQIYASLLTRLLAWPDYTCNLVLYVSLKQLVDSFTSIYIPTTEDKHCLPRETKSYWVYNLIQHITLTKAIEINKLLYINNITSSNHMDLGQIQALANTKKLPTRRKPQYPTLDWVLWFSSGRQQVTFFILTTRPYSPPKYKQQPISATKKLIIQHRN